MNLLTFVGATRQGHEMSSNPTLARGTNWLEMVGSMAAVSVGPNNQARRARHQGWMCCNHAGLRHSLLVDLVCLPSDSMTLVWYLFPSWQVRDPVSRPGRQVVALGTDGVQLYVRGRVSHAELTGHTWRPLTVPHPGAAGSSRSGRLLFSRIIRS